MRVVLIEPKDSRNVGAVARAMQNLGYYDLALVSPRNWDREQAGVLARNATGILDNALVCADVTAAIMGCTEVVGVALREGENPTRFLTLPQWAARRESGHRTALLFGPEDDDLRREHLEKCRYVVRIPSSAAYPSFNLAQSVLLVLYELERTGAISAEKKADWPEEREWTVFEGLLNTVMTESGFTRPGSPAPVPGAVRNLFRRTHATRHELSLLTALFGRLQSALRREKSHD
jgi:TrmH family RNA methyltransferase